MDEAPLSRNQGTVEKTDVRSSSPRAFDVAGVGSSPQRNDTSTLPSGDAGRRGAASIDIELHEELHENEQPCSLSCSALGHPLRSTYQTPNVIQRHESTDPLMSPDVASSFGFELTNCNTDLQSRSDSSVIGSGEIPSLSYCPLLESLLVWCNSNGDDTATAEHAAAGQAEPQDRADPCHQATPADDSSDDVTAVRSSPNSVCNVRRRLNSQDLMKIRKMARKFLNAMRLASCCRQQMPSPSLLDTDRIRDLRHVVMQARNSVLHMLHYASQLPQFRRKPPRVQVALLKASSAGCMVLQLAQYYNCERGCWLHPRGTEFRPRDLAALVPSPTRPELWDDVAATGRFLKTFVHPSSESADVHRDDSMLRFYSLLNAVLIMSPENVPCVRESDRDIAADVSDFQQSCILLLRHYLESSLSVAQAAKLLPTLLTHLIVIRSLALSVRIALLSERLVRRDSVLGDALSLELATL